MKQSIITVLVIVMFAAASPHLFAGKPILWGQVRAVARNTVQNDVRIDQLDADGYRLQAIRGNHIKYSTEPSNTYNWGTVVFIYSKSIPGSSCKADIVYVTVRIDIIRKPRCRRDIQVVSINIR